MNGLAPVATPAFILTLVSGPKKGTQYKINSPHITIGRSRNNDISVDDPKCSRQHVEIKFDQHGPIARNLTNNNELFVNNAPVDEARLVDRSRIRFGESEFMFEIQNMGPSSTDLALASNGQPSLPQNLAHPNGGLTQRDSKYGGNPGAGSSRKKRPPAKSKKGFYTIVGVIGFLFTYLLLSETPQQKEAPGILTDTELEQRIEKNIEQTRAQRDALIKSGKKSDNFKLAQKSYVAGFRDYEKGNYERAVQSFQACLSLYPTHTLCTRYLKLSTRKYQELIHYYMVNGRKHLDANQFTRCVSDFKNVMYMVRVRSNSLYKEASTNYEYCKLQLEGRY